MGLLIGLVALALGAPHANGAAKATSYLNLDLRQQRYLGDVQHSTQSSNYTQLSANLNLEPKPERSGRLIYKVNARAQGAFEAREESYFGVPELFVEGRSQGSSLALGRKRRMWSRLDEEFDLGVWQPQLRWDYLMPEQQGLTGMFFEHSFSPRWRFVLFASGVNLPDQGPQFRLENGRFYSANRWFQQPFGYVRLFQDTPFTSDAPLYFQIDRPSDQEIFFRPSAAIGVEYGESMGLWSRFNVAYKPRNQIHLGIECANCANLGGTQPVEITTVIHPKILNHLVTTWEFGVERVDDRAWASITGEWTDASQFPSHYEEAPIDDVLIAGLAYQHYVGSWLGGRPSWLQYSYVRVVEIGPKSKSGLLKEEDQVKSSLDRYPLKNFAALDWKIRLAQTAKNLWNWTNRLQYSIPEQGSWLSSFLDLNQGPVTWFVGMDILGSQVEATSSRAGLFTRYRANDRIFGGVSYVF